MWTKVESSNIEAMRLDETTMQVKFKNGSTYAYENVPVEKFQEIIEAASVGRTFNELIKSKPIDYPYQRVA